MHTPITPAVAVPIGVPIGFATHVSITPPAASARRRTPPLATALMHGEINRQRATAPNTARTAAAPRRWPQPLRMAR